MSALEVREVECFLSLAETLHFGRSAEQLYLSQSRVSQLLASLERRVGGKLLERSSRTVKLTVLGTDFLNTVGSAYVAFDLAFNSVRGRAMAMKQPLRLGFERRVDGGVLEAVKRYERESGTLVQLVDQGIADPFGPLRRGEVDASIGSGPMLEPDLIGGLLFGAKPLVLLMSAEHPLAIRSVVHAEEFDEFPLLELSGPAPAYWKDAKVPRHTPAGKSIPRAESVASHDEALAQIVLNRGMMLLCQPSAKYYARDGVAMVPVQGLPSSVLSLIWRRNSCHSAVQHFLEVLQAVVSSPELVASSASDVGWEAAASA